MQTFRNPFSLMALLVAFAITPYLQADEYTILETQCGTRFEVNRAWLPAINKQIAKLTAEITEAKRQNKTIVYISLPLSHSKPGSSRIFNTYLGQQMAEFIKSVRGEGLHIITPGTTEMKLRTSDTHIPAKGGDYLYMWTNALAGKDCKGMIDEIYYLDQDSITKTSPVDTQAPSHALAYHLEQISNSDETLYRQILDEVENNLDQFYHFYETAYSFKNSPGARDEFNLVQQLRSRNPEKTIIQHHWGFWFHSAQPFIKKGYEL